MTPHLPFTTTGNRHAPQSVPVVPGSYKRYFINTIFLTSEKFPALIEYR